MVRSTNRNNKKKKNVFKVEELRGFRVKLENGSLRRQYYVKWDSYSDSESSWEDKANIHDPDLISDFEQRLATDKASWEYYLDTKVDSRLPGWHKYDAPTSDKVEDAYKKDDSKSKFTVTGAYRSMSGTQYSYTLDFDSMTQYNTATGRTRPIRRLWVTCTPTSLLSPVATTTTQLLSQVATATTPLLSPATPTILVPFKTVSANIDNGVYNSPAAV